ncbi:MarR family winged helix-turn-helix transcriptional regulator [Peribacillus castrilensis]|uniref:MarR family transcriptional regulator n=1 Tax=Peribacillus simplex TaxID=1478 RepID=A0A9X9ESM1_9BACI|nr:MULTISPECIES: MarR family transcriptional regulator [Bacillaceae]KOR81865.1 MarR family transcriptional regulator [Bacillus sp. FJAT-21352]KOR87368.1 MarR family transcriptional regulator [Bacillus sp. FJAT-22058]KRF48009.1 MarR family transcriptional regulator [Bacillus sp. Soil745]MBT2604311.1 MarR family transcriptional regulator [Bacillus sp. ISL-53]MCP1095000.1 MarR family transcriptional regulator [Bacillaceae bacterium OS4b]PEF35952.1 MarR family transcriptional regulator [Bacillus 
MKTFQKFFQQLLLLYRPFENNLNIQLNKHDLHRAQWSILYYLNNYGSATLVELANYQSVEKPTITRTIARLEELGYVEHVPSKDKREKRMRLTELGKKVYSEVRVTIDQYEQEILKGITEEEQLAAIRIMGEIRNNIIK